MRRFKVSLTIGYPAANRHDILEFEDDATQEQIDADVHEWAMNYVEFYADEITEDEE